MEELFSCFLYRDGRQLFLYSCGLTPVWRLKYLPKNDALGKLSE